MTLDGVRLRVAVGLAVYLVAIGALGGALVERWRFDQQRTRVLRRHDAAIRVWKDERMVIDRRGIRAVSATDPPATDVASR